MKINSERLLAISVDTEDVCLISHGIQLLKQFKYRVQSLTLSDMSTQYSIPNHVLQKLIEHRQKYQVNIELSRGSDWQCAWQLAKILYLTPDEYVPGYFKMLCPIALLLMGKRMNKQGLTPTKQVPLSLLSLATSATEKAGAVRHL
jgi:hypothetical protein